MANSTTGLLDFFLLVEQKMNDKEKATKYDELLAKANSGEEVLDIRLPAHVKLEVSHTEPGVKGNTATGATKPATLETNYTVNVPLFVEEGDVLKVDTRSGEYIERVKS